MDSSLAICLNHHATRPRSTDADSAAQDTVQATLLLLAAGACRHLAAALFFGSGNAGFRTALCLWSLPPYLLLALMLVRKRNIHGIALFVGALAAVLIDTGAFWSVFIGTRHSTSALNLLAAPFWNLFCVAPLAFTAEACLARMR